MRPTDASWTPWARDAIHAAGLTRAEITELIPSGWRLTGFARSSRGPWTFRLINEDPDVVAMTHERTVRRIADVREAIAGLLASVTPDLELQLRASLHVLGVEA